MKSRIMMIATLVMAIYNIVMAEDKVTINDFNISAGEKKEISISLDNDVAYVAFQFDLYLPDGISVESYNVDSERIPESTTLSMSSMNDGGYRFIAAAMQGEPLIGSSGNIIKLTVKASESLTHGEKVGYFRKIKLALADATGSKYSEMSFPIIVIEPSVVTANNYTRKYGEANPDLDYTVTGGALDGVPTITCEANATSPVGTYPIVITKGTIENYNVTYVAGTLTITKAPLIIAADTYIKKQGEAMPEFTLTYNGFKNNETKNVLTKQPTVSCQATEASAPGEYSVVVSGAEAQNYDISYTNGKLIVVDADAVVVKAKNYTREYGEDNPVFEFTTEGATLEGTPQISCEATAESPVGTYDIVVSQGTVSNYNVSYVAGTLTVIKAPLTISADTYTKKQGEAMPEFVLTYDGFKNNETKDVLTRQPIVSCEATEANAPGEYPVIVSGAEAQNYDISYTNGKLVVVDADAVVVKAKNYTREYGEDNPLFEFTAEGATLEGTPQISCEATATSPVGTYNIVVGQGTVSNYNVSYVAGTLTITKAPLKIAADTYTKKQGEAMPEFTLAYNGFRNNETKDVLTKLPTVSCQATEASAPGEYPVVVSGAEAHNYDISYTNGKLIVVDADAVIVKAKSCTREYGEDNPTFEYTVEGAELVGEPVITCEATATSPAGTYDIVVSQGTVSNFNVSYIAGTLTITKAPLTITAGTYTKKQYDPMPEFKVSYDGFKNNETELVLTKQPVISCEANEESSPGEYDIVVGGAEALNYEIQYVSGKLTVTEPDSYSLTYMVDGEEYKSFTVKYRETITPLNAPEREGYTFSGWSDIPATMPANDVVVTGTFTVNTYAVTFMYNDKVLKVDSVEYGAVIPLPTSLNSDRYTLIEWLDVPETMPAHDITIYASVVDGILTLTDEVDYKIYNERGLRISRLQRGLNIIKYSNGRIRKVIVK